jgi:hypothetical protein
MVGEVNLTCVVPSRIFTPTPTLKNERDIIWRIWHFTCVAAGEALDDSSGAGGYHLQSVGAGMGAEMRLALV